MTRSIRCVVLLLALLSGRSLSANGFWLDVPFVKQEGRGCGAAVLSMILQYWSLHSDRIRAAHPVYNAAEIMKELYSPESRGIFAKDMESYLQTNGFQTFVLQALWEDLEHHLSRGRPMIVSLAKGNALHYVVVAGIDSERSVVFLNDPAERKLSKMDRSQFEKEWKAMKRWALLAVPKE